MSSVMSLGSRIREERKRLRLSQAQLAELCGVKRRMQIYIEQDEKAPGGRYLEALSANKADMQYVLTGLRIDDVPGANETIAASDVAKNWVKGAGLSEDDPLFYPFAGVITALRNGADVDGAISSLVQAYIEHRKGRNK